MVTRTKKLFNNEKILIFDILGHNNITSKEQITTLQLSQTLSKTYTFTVVDTTHVRRLARELGNHTWQSFVFKRHRRPIHAFIENSRLHLRVHHRPNAKKPARRQQSANNSDFKSRDFSPVRNE